MNQQQLVSYLGLAGVVMVVVAQPVKADTVKVTAIELNPTSRGIKIVLNATSSKQLQTFTSSYGKTFVANVINSQLQLPSSNTFRQENPTEGIAGVTVSSVGANSIRIIVTGKTQLPRGQVTQSNRGLVLSLSAPATTDRKPTTPKTPESVQLVEPTSPDIQPNSQTQPTKPTAPTQELQPERDDEEIEIVVTGEQEEGYRVPNASTATRTDTPIRDIPQSIQVIPQQVLEDRQVTRIEEALSNVSGVTFLGNEDSRGVNFSIRGFRDAPVLRDGFRTYSFNQAFPEVANLERIEVLKGPASILFGEIQPGGVINLVTKKPLNEPFYEAQLQVGSRGFIQPRIDVSELLTDDGRLRYRLNALYQRSDSFRDYDQENRRFFISPVLSWRISDSTDLSVSLEYINDKRPADFGTLAFDDGVADVPRDRIFNEPDDIIKNEYLSVGYNFEHRFSDNWKLRNAFRYTYYNYDYNVLALQFLVDEEARTVTRFFASQEQENKDYTFQTNVTGKFATGSINHTLLFGVDFNHSTDDNLTVGVDGEPLELNIFNPVYRQFPKPDEDTLPLFSGDETQTDRLGIYIQDQISLFENLKLLAGLRYDTVEQETTSTDSTSTSSEISQSPDAFTPRIGIVYQPIEALSLYASYSQSFNPNTETTANDDPLEPETGEGYEVGVKAELLKDRLFATLAYFDITKKNVATDDPINFGASVATGKQQSQGIEFDAIGEILPGWNIIASYAYIDAEVTEDNTPEIVGNNLAGVPKHSASLWTTYEIQSGNLQGLGFGVGFNYVGERQGDLDNSFEVDSYFLTNAAIFYRRENWQFALNFKNLFDVNYIEAVGNSRVRGIYPGEPFTVVGSVSLEF